MAKITQRDVDRSGVLLAYSLGLCYCPTYLTPADLAELDKHGTYTATITDPRNGQPYRDEPAALTLTHAGNTAYRFDVIYIGSGYSKGMYTVHTGSRGVLGPHQGYSLTDLDKQVTAVVNFVGLVKVGPKPHTDPYRDNLDEAYRLCRASHPSITVDQFCTAAAAVLSAHRENVKRSADWLARMCGLAAGNEAELAQLGADRFVDVKNMVGRLEHLTAGARHSSSVWRFDLTALESLELVTRAVEADMGQLGGERAGAVLLGCGAVLEMVRGARAASLPGCVKRDHYTEVLTMARGLV